MWGAVGTVWLRVGERGGGDGANDASCAATPRSQNQDRDSQPDSRKPSDRRRQLLLRPRRSLPRRSPPHARQSNSPSRRACRRTSHAAVRTTRYYSTAQSRRRSQRARKRKQTARPLPTSGTRAARHLSRGTRPQKMPRGAWGARWVRTVKPRAGRSSLSRRSLARRCRAMIRPSRSRGVCRLGLGEARSVRAMVACCVHALHVPRKQRASAHVLLSLTALQCQHHAG